MITTIIFDLDGTLLPMDQDIFAKAYFKRLSAKVYPLGYEPQKLVNVIWQGMEAMYKNDGIHTNEDVFWNCFMENYGSKVLEDKLVFDEFYKNEFQEVAESCGCNPNARILLDMIKQKGYRTVLATNPIFPAVATESRVRWAGLQKEDFEFITTYENSRHCKPNPEYYRDVLSSIACKPEECLMVGNDVTEDMVAATLGMHVFLLTDCLINKEEKDISVYPHGGFLELMTYIQELS